MVASNSTVRKKKEQRLRQSKQLSDLLTCSYTKKSQLELYLSTLY